MRAASAARSHSLADAFLSHILGHNKPALRPPAPLPSEGPRPAKFARTLAARSLACTRQPVPTCDGGPVDPPPRAGAAAGAKLGQGGESVGVVPDTQRARALHSGGSFAT